MFLTIQDPYGRYKVQFLIDKSSLHFKKGPKRKQPRVSTTCWIYCLSERGEEEIGVGYALQSWRDEPCDFAGRKFAMARALKGSYLGKPSRSQFWQEFHSRFKKAEPRESVIQVILEVGKDKDEADVRCVTEAKPKQYGLGWPTRAGADSFIFIDKLYTSDPPKTMEGIKPSIWSWLLRRQ